MRGWWTIWAPTLLVLHMTGQFHCAKDHRKADVHKPEQNNKEEVARFTIPHPNHPESAFIPEAIGQSVGTERGQIVGTELPGAYGEDYDMEGMESGSGVTSGSGSGNREKDTDSPESPGKFGTNLVHNPPPSNPSAAFEGNVHGDEEEEKEDVDLGKELDADGAQKDEKEEKKEDEPSPLPEVVTKSDKESRKESEKSDKEPKKTEKHHGKAEKSSKVAKKKTKAKAKDHDENNMISKIDAIAKQIEKVEHREKLDRKEAATLKVAKKVAKKVIKNINAKKKHKNSHKVSHKSSNIVSQALSHALSHKDFDEFAEEEEKPSSHFAFHKKEKSHAAKEAKGPEGFECPWACFWTCHSYCPKECCNNPFKCDLGCREFCTPYCTDRCCAPGSQRLPKLQINFNSEDERKNISAIFAEDDKHQLPTNTTSVSVSASPQSPREKEEEDAKLHTRLDPAENSYQQLKEQEHQIALANQIEALKKATSYAAQLMGLPPECPLACARICLPGLCKQQCCARSQVPNVPVVPPAVFHAPAQNPMGNFNPALPIPSAERAPIVSGPQVNPSRNQLALANQFAMAQKQRYLMAHNSAAAAAFQQQKANAYMMNKLALQNRMLEGKNDFALPALARYRAMQYANQMNRQKLLLKNNLESQASRQQIADATQRCEAGYPCQQQQQQQQHVVSSSSSSSPSWLHNCPPICRSSCIPQCPNECCTHAARGTASM
jgi:hypothetical protein